jgi:tetratricopeptide (TPR) repeat protein
MLTMLSYAWYVKRPYHREGAGIFRYVLVLVCFLLGLMAKPMLVTLPFVLLLLDYWPLNRLQETLSGAIGKTYKFSIIRALIWEKVPLFILAITISVATYVVQSDWGAVASINDLPIYVRFSNALISYAIYLLKMIWPFALAIIYPHPGKVLVWHFAGALLTVAVISLLAFKAARQAPFFIVGWLWYLGTLVPVIGIVQVGSQAFADRYTYIPLIGIFITIVWGIPALVPNRQYYKLIITLCSVAIIALFTATTWLQIKTWANSDTLFEHALKIDPDNYLAHTYLGDNLEKRGEIKKAFEHYTKAIQIKPNYELFNINMARVLAEQGQIKEAVEYYSEALRLNPDSANAHNGLGLVLFRREKVSEAIYHFSEAIKIEPLYAEAHNNVGLALFEIGKNEKAIHHFKEAIKIRPGFVKANDNLSMALESKQ